MINKSSFFHFFIFSSLLLLASCDSIGLYFASKKTTINSENSIVYIPSNSSLSDVYKLLEKAEILEDSDVFFSIAEYKNLNDDRIGAGKYEIAANMLIKDLLNAFTLNSLGNGNKELEVTVTFNNCRTIYDLAGKVGNQLELDSSLLINYIKDESFLAKHQLNEKTVGILFLPDSYRMFWDTDEIAFMDRMVENFSRFWNKERKEKIKSIGLKNPNEVVTLASIVYKEQDKHPSEWRTIAGLYLNRIKNGWLLQSDPTFVFCWGDKLKEIKRLTYEHRSIDCPYNTYKYAGLPPGPIYLPPAQVIDAVLNAEENNYFYMCAKPAGNGLHNFANSLSEHNKNAKAYQNWLSKNKIR